MRRWFVSVGIAVIAAGSITAAQDSAQAPTSAEALARLKAGNARFVSHPEDAVWNDVARRTALAASQAPFATILSCADSRVPPEVVFRAGLGDLFVVRAAGHVTDRSILASVEYAAEHLRVPLVVVMGHESCGAVRAANDTPASTSLSPNLDYMLKAIRPSVAAVRTAPEAARLRAAILEHVEETLNSMTGASPLLRNAAKSGQLMLVGAYYELSSGKVFFSEPADLSSTMSSAHQPSGARAEAGRH